jgi:hydroxypyruvate reductase
MPIPQFSAGEATQGDKPMSEGGNREQRATLLEMFDAAVQAAHPMLCLPPHLPLASDKGRIVVIGAGKAAAAMAVAAETHYGRHGMKDRLAGFITTRHGYGLPTEVIEIVEAGHPVPDANSVAAAARALALAGTAGPDDIVLVLLSGGASALWSAPVEGISIKAKQALTRALLKVGARISEINCVRKHLSRIKGGKLAAAAYPARLVTLAISDVPGDDPAIIGSGPTVGDPTTLADARGVLSAVGSLLKLYDMEPPSEVTAALENSANETIKPGAKVLSSAEYHIVAAPKASLEAAATIARSKGYRVVTLGDALEGEARDVALIQADLAREALSQGDRIALLSGGELTVTVRGNGSGGPNQEFALALAIALEGAPGVSALAADTDGTDGGSGSATDPAGAIVVADTVARAQATNLKAATFLANNDSTGFFAQLGDLVRCGPTQTNVNDFRAILIDP